MNLISEFLQNDHRDLDARFAVAGQQVQAGDWANAKISVVRFARALGEHIAMEQEIVFPALARHVDVSGPCQVMKIEHDEMHGLLETLYAACRDHEKQAFNDAAKSLNERLQAHNSKEENILYPLADQVLAAQAADLVAQMRGSRMGSGGCGGGGQCGCGHAA